MAELLADFLDSKTSSALAGGAVGQFFWYVLPAESAGVGEPPRHVAGELRCRG